MRRAAEFLLVRTNRTLPVIGDSGFLSGAMFPGSGLSLPEVKNLPDKLVVGQPIPRWPPPQDCLEASRAGRGGGPDEAPGGRCERPLAVVTLRSELTNYDLTKDAKSLKDAEDIDQMRVPRHPIVVMMLVIAELVNEHHFQARLPLVLFFEGLGARWWECFALRVRGAAACGDVCGPSLAPVRVRRWCCRTWTTRAWRRTRATSTSSTSASSRATRPSCCTARCVSRVHRTPWPLRVRLEAAAV